MRPNHKILAHFGAFGLGVLVLFWAWSNTLLHMVDIIWNVDSYSHGIMVPFVTLALIWSRKDQLFIGEIRSYLPGILLLAVAILIWLFGEAAEIKLFSHLGLVAGIQALIIICFGPVVFRRLLFPFLFLFLAIPVGDSLIPLLQTLTAEMVISVLGWLGVAYSAEGVLITLSSGVYEVARACAGIKFLFTSLVTGALLANLAYSTIRGRIAIMIVAAILPIFANAGRVLGVLLIAEATDASFAKGVDHLVYGWGFLSFILVLLIAVAYRFSDKEGETDTKPEAFRDRVKFEDTYWWAAPGLAVSLLIGSTHMAPEAAVWSQGAIINIGAPECEDCEFRLLDTDPNFTGPLFRGADQTFLYQYRSAADKLAISGALYCPQRNGSRLVQIGNLPGGAGWSLLPGTAMSNVDVGNWHLQKRIYWKGQQRKHVLLAYYVNGHTVVTEMAAKIETAKERFLKGRSVGAMLVVTAPIRDAASPIENKIEKFLSTFPKDKFLWKDSKSLSKDQNLCVA